jgi:molybdopterin-guanine dinucleotide biosynthesis protein A
MGVDKGLLVYHGLPQRYFLYELLHHFCEKVFLSCNPGQAPGIPGNFQVITDNPLFENAGPMTGLLSAFRLYPGAAFLTIGCDYPFIGKEHLQLLVSSRDQQQVATCYYNSISGIEEPLLAIYEKEAYSLLLSALGINKFSLRYFLKENGAVRVKPATVADISSVDTPEAYVEAMKKLGKNSASGQLGVTNLPGT